MARRTLASTAAALAAHDRIQALSDEIRARADEPLDPVPENAIVRAWRQTLADSPSGAAKLAAAKGESAPAKATAPAKKKAGASRGKPAAGTVLDLKRKLAAHRAKVTQYERELGEAQQAAA